MAFLPFEVNVVHLVYAILGAFVVLVGFHVRPGRREGSAHPVLSRQSVRPVLPAYKGAAVHRRSRHRHGRRYCIR